MYRYDNKVKYSILYLISYTELIAWISFPSLSFHGKISLTFLIGVLFSRVSALQSLLQTN